MGKFNKGMKVTGTDSFVNKGKIYIEFFHLPSGTEVAFKGYITSYNETYNVNFEETDVYGRMDSIAIYKGTKRKISLGWTLVAETHEEAWENWRSVQTYIKMLYPSYNTFLHGQKQTSRFSATTLGSPPLLRVKFMNLIANARAISLQREQQAGLDKAGFAEVSYNDGTAKNAGLLVVPGSLTVDPQFADRGAFIYGAKNVDRVKRHKGLNATSVPDVEFSPDNPFALPLEITLSTDYTVLHDHDLGWGKTVKPKKVKGIKSKTATSTKPAKAKKKGKAAASVKKKAVKAKKQKVMRNVTGRRSTARKEFNRFPYGIKEDAKS